MIIEVENIGQPELDIYTSLTEAQLRAPKADDCGLFIAESPKVIRVAIERGYAPVSLLCERRHITGDASDIIQRFPSMPVYTSDRHTLRSITGYTLTRGVLCAMRRKPLPTLREVCREGRLVCVLQSVTDTTNIGAIFRSASALGVDPFISSLRFCSSIAG